MSQTRTEVKDSPFFIPNVHNDDFGAFNDVNNSPFSCPSHHEENVYIGSFEKHTLGIGKNILTNMGYEKGQGLGINGQGLIQPMDITGRPRFTGLGYRAKESSKVAEIRRTSKVESRPLPKSP